MNDNRFGLFIKELRNEKGLSQEELGAILFVHRTTINKWEKGKVIPLNDTLLAVSDFFDVSVDELLNGKRNIKEEKDLSTGWAIIDLIRSNKKLYKALVISGIVIFTFSIVFLLYYFVTTYDSTHVYILNGENEKIKMREGLMIISNDKLYFRIGDFYNSDKKINLDSDTKIYIVYRNDKNEDILLQGDVRDLFVELSKSKELLIRLLEEHKPLYLKFEYDGTIEEIEVKYYEDFSNDKIVSVEDNSICKNNQNDDICADDYNNQIKPRTLVESDTDTIIDVLIKNGFKYDENKGLYFLKNGKFTYYYNVESNYLVVIEKYSKRKVNFYNLYFNEKSFKNNISTNDEDIYIKDYCNINEFDKNYIIYQNFYNKILPHYFRDLLGCE